MPDTLDLDRVARAIADEAERRRNIARASALMPHITTTSLAQRLAAINDAEALAQRLAAINDAEARTLDLLEQVRAYLEPQ